MTDTHHQAHDPRQPTHHIVPIPVYLAIFATLICMTALTVWVAFRDLGELNVVLALAIAVFKASLVVLFFMHVKYSNKLTQLASVTGFIWLAIFIGFTLSDYGTRQWVGAAEGWAMQPADVGLLDQGAVEGHGEAGAEHGESHAEEAAH